MIHHRLYPQFKAQANRFNGQKGNFKLQGLIERPAQGLKLWIREQREHTRPPPQPVYTLHIFPPFIRYLTIEPKLFDLLNSYLQLLYGLQIKNLNHNPVMAENPINCCGMGKMTLWNFMPGINPSFLITTNL